MVAHTPIRRLDNAQLHEIILKNPFDVVTRPTQINTKRERKQENYLNSEQLTRFLHYWESKPVPQYAYFRFLAYTGLRRGEIIALTWDDLDFKHVSLHGLRHTHATLLFEQAASQGKAAPIKAVQKRLGHADVAMTLQIYTNATNKEDEIIDEILDTGFN